MTLVLIWATFSIVISFLCSILESVLLSITSSFIAAENRAGTKTGEVLTAYKKDIDRPLSAILTLNTLAHTVGAIGVGAAAGAAFGTKSIDLHYFSLSYESIVAAIMTIAILLLSEIIPKTIGAKNWKSLASFTVTTTEILMVLLSPLVAISKMITNMLGEGEGHSVLSRGDFAAIVEEGNESGSLDESEAEIIKNLLHFEKQTARDIMTPKMVALMGQEDVTIEDFYKENQPIRFSRIPIYAETRDHITGMILKDEILKKIIEGKGDEPVKSIARKINSTEDSIALPNLFKSLTREKNHLSIVTDNFGAVVGVVSMEDLFETLLGVEIMDEFDKVDDLQKLAKKDWEKRKKDK